MGGMGDRELVVGVRVAYHSSFAPPLWRAARSVRIVGEQLSVTVRKP
jgi:hypothetical protein